MKHMRLYYPEVIKSTHPTYDTIVSAQDLLDQNTTNNVGPHSLSPFFFLPFFLKKTTDSLKPSEKTGAGTGNLKKSSSEESPLHAR